MTGPEFGEQRRAAGIVGELVCRRAGMNRTKLSTYERGYIDLPPEEQERIENALRELVQAKQKLAAIRAQFGLPVSAL